MDLLRDPYAAGLRQAPEHLVSFARLFIRIHHGDVPEFTAATGLSLASERFVPAIESAKSILNAVATPGGV